MKKDGMGWLGGRVCTSNATSAMHGGCVRTDDRCRLDRMQLGRSVVAVSAPCRLDRMQLGRSVVAVSAPVMNVRDADLGGG
jgi:hypothetical protein